MAASRAWTRGSAKRSAGARWRVHYPRTVQLIQHVRSESGVVADPLDAQQASVGGEADPGEIVEVVQPSADVEVVGVVDDRLGA